MLHIFNTLSRKKEIFKPLHGKQVGLYTCGPTVYNYAHIGNLRTYVFEDVLQRALEYNGYKVKRVMNTTDVGHLTSDADTGEDKIEKEAKKEKKSVWDVTKFYTEEFLKDIKDLNIKVPKLLVPATKTIPEQIKIVKTLFKKGLAYETSKAVYFDVSKFRNYTELSRQPLSEKITAAREEVVADPEKRHPADFALWFKLVGDFKNHIMRWPSPWSDGFPGWHIECSAISTKFLGQPFDIHTGGVDHINVHHTNEIAQSEGAFNKPLAKYWMHGEFLLIDQNRMGKSVGNFITINDLKKEGFDPLAFRYLILTSHYRSRLNFSWDSLKSAANAYVGLKHNLSLLQGYSKLKTKNASESKQLIATAVRKFKNAINDDLNTPEALGSIHELLNQLAGLQKENKLNSQNAGLALKEILKLDSILGLNLKNLPKIPAKIRQMAKKRELLRANKQFTQADALRKEIETLGFSIEDTPAGPLVIPN
ncbi:MAG: cysteine--tRNA ligase [Candidatus Harrisonbacteria bacterium]|nr:cysteine--tRNA ligase [Candidatus Harrisonbacteria bacterium]